MCSRNLRCLALPDVDSDPGRTRLDGIAANRPGEEKRLREVLRPIGMISGPHVDRRQPSAPRLQPQPDDPLCTIRHSRRSKPRARTKAPALSSNYDGDLNDHLAELMAITSDLDTIWGHCEGYAGAARFGAFIRAHTREPEAFYIAFRDEPSNAFARSSRSDGGCSPCSTRRLVGPFDDPPAPLNGRAGLGRSLRLALGESRTKPRRRDRTDRQSAPDCGRCAESDRPVRLHERLSGRATDPCQPRPAPRWSDGSTGSRGITCLRRDRSTRALAWTTRQP